MFSHSRKCQEFMNENIHTHINTHIHSPNLDSAFPKAPETHILSLSESCCSVCVCVCVRVSVCVTGKRCVM